MGVSQKTWSSEPGGEQTCPGRQTGSATGFPRKVLRQLGNARFPLTLKTCPVDHDDESEFLAARAALTGLKTLHAFRRGPALPTG